MNCKSCRRLVFELRDRSLPARDAQALEAHLSNCPECRASYAEEELIGGRIGAAFRQAAAAFCVVLPVSPAPGDGTCHPVPGRSSRRRALRFLIPAAAGSAILAAVLLFSPSKASWTIEPTTSELVTLDDFPDPLRDWNEGRLLITVEDAARGTRETFLTTRDGAIRRVAEEGKIL